MKEIHMTKLASTLAMVAACSAAGAAGGHGAAPDARSIERGRYILKITGCNDCHTPHYAARAGDVPESQWLTGDRLGFRGPWGTTYPSNLRLYMTQLSEDQWLQKARTLQTRPPMPWFALRQIDENDLRAMYRFVMHLGPGGTPVPPYVPPGRDVKPPYIQWPMAPTTASK
jgi:mono/diheme cytochrome c family protein